MGNPGLTISLGLALAALALPAPGEAAEIEEIIVTAQKREESAHDVGLTLSAFGAESYRTLAGGTLDGLTSQIPNVEAYLTGTFFQSVHVRGIGLNEFQGQFDSPVAQHVDEVYVSKPWMIARPMYDVQRVEVLKGPQGTLFGRNTTGGALNYYTSPPTEEATGYLQMAVDEHERYSLQGAMSGPLSPGLLGRLSFRGDFGSGGPQKNLFDAEEHGKPDLFDLRGQLSWHRDRLTARVLMHGGRDTGEKLAFKGPGIFNLGAPGLCPELFSGDVTHSPESCAKSAGFAILNGNPQGEFEPSSASTINQNTPPRVDDTFYGGYLRLDYELERATLTSITAFEYYERIHSEDSQSDIFNSTSTHYYNQIDQFSQELRLTGDLSEQWRYVAGFFYERDDLDQIDGSDLSGQQLPGITPPFANQFFGQFNLEVESIAVFAHTEYDPVTDVTINLGIRYTSDSTDVDDAMLGLGNLPQTGKKRRVTPCLITTFPGGPIGTPACPFLGPYAPLYSDSRNDENVSWRAGVEWRPTENVLLYANLTTGYRGGGYSLPFAGAATTFEPEELFAQEAGLKGRFLNGAIETNLAVFRYDYDDVQVNVDDPVSPLVPITRNIGEQENLGFEGEFVWRPTPRLYVKQALGYLDAEFGDTDRAITTYAGAIPVDGKRPVNTPQWTYNGVLSYWQPVGDNWDIAVTVDYRWIDDRYLEASNQPFDRARDYWVANLRIALSARDHSWEFAIFAKNLFDEEYLTYINNIAFFKLDIFGERRSVGASIRYSFE